MRINSFLIPSIFLLCLLPVSSASAQAVTVQPKSGNWQQRYEAFGKVTAQSESFLQLPYSIHITKVLVSQGEFVKAHQAILQFEAPQLHREISNYQAIHKMVVVSKKQLNYLQGIRKKQLIPSEKVYNAEQLLAQLEAKENLAWEQLHADFAVLGHNYDQVSFNRLLITKNKMATVTQIVSELRAPFAGRVINRPPSAGVWIERGKQLIELEDISRVYVTVAVPDTQLSKWLTGKTLLSKARLLSDIPSIDTDSGLRQLHFQAKNPNQQLQEGEWIRVVHLSPAVKVLWLPETAVVSRNGKAWCVVKDGKEFKPVEIKVGVAEQGKIPVLSGLKKHQLVVTEGAYELLYKDLKSLIKFVD